MKVNKKGEIKLDNNEVRVGNYVVREEKDYIKVMDINGMLSFRYHNVFIGKGLYYKELLAMVRRGEEGAEEVLKTVCFVDHYLLTAIYDKQGMEDIVSKVTEIIKRRPELYGMDANPTEEKNEQDLQATKDLLSLQEEFKEKLQNES